jgi:hypothetical protein
MIRKTNIVSERYVSEIEVSNKENIPYLSKLSETVKVLHCLIKLIKSDDMAERVYNYLIANKTAFNVTHDFPKWKNLTSNERSLGRAAMGNAVEDVLTSATNFETEDNSQYSPLKCIDCGENLTEHKDTCSLSVQTKIL